MSDQTVRGRGVYGEVVSSADEEEPVVNRAYYRALRDAFPDPNDELETPVHLTVKVTVEYREQDQ